jgi:hypothetical protein
MVSMKMLAEEVEAARELSSKMLRVGVLEALGPSAEKGQQYTVVLDAVA